MFDLLSWKDRLGRMKIVFWCDGLSCVEEGNSNYLGCFIR